MAWVAGVDGCRGGWVVGIEAPVQRKLIPQAEQGVGDVGEGGGHDAGSLGRPWRSCQGWQRRQRCAVERGQGPYPPPSKILQIERQARRLPIARGICEAARSGQFGIKSPWPWEVRLQHCARNCAREHPKRPSRHPPPANEAKENPSEISKSPRGLDLPEGLQNRCSAD